MTTKEKQGFGLYFLLAFGLAWLCQVGGCMALLQKQNAVLYQLALVATMLCPLLAVLLVQKVFLRQPTGSLNVFAHQTNIDTRNRIICYDIQDLGENLKPIGLLVMLDSILNRVIRNRQQGRYTHVYIDEIYLFFASPGVGGKSAINNYSSEFLYKCWKRFRKYYATLTGITQNVEECLLSDTARLMFANSEFLVLLNQAPTDRAELAKLLDASDAQMDYVSDAPAGHGLIKVGSCLVPFINELPRDTELYRLMTTKPGEQNA